MNRWIKQSQGLALSALMMLLTACGGFMSSRNAVLMPEKDMQDYGEAAYRHVRQTVPVDREPADWRYVNCVKAQLLPQLESPLNAVNWDVMLFADSRPAAFALPSGQIGLTAGLLDTLQNQHQLAAVMAHELGHLRYQHSNERLTTNLSRQEKSTLQQTLSGADSAQRTRALSLLGLGSLQNDILPYARRQESEADLFALGLMARAGFDPRQAVVAWQRLTNAGAGAAQAYIGTHPLGDRRAYDLNRVIETPLAEYGRTRASGVNPKCR